MTFNIKIMNTKRTIKFGLLALLASATIIGCKKDDDLPQVPDPVENEQEVITTMRLIFVDSASIQPTVTATFRDPDGDGGNGPDIFDTIRLANNTTYLTTILLLNETESPADTISNEVLEEGADHLFCFTPSGADATIVLTDSDGSLPIGLQSKWYTGAISNGTVQVVLKHQPGVKDGTCSPGETDIDITYVTEIQ